jgi:hypothetical protein
MAAPKKGASAPKSRASARVASRAKGAARASASKTSAKQERAAVGRSLAKPAKIQESGAGWGNIVRAAASIAGRSKPVAKKAEPRKPKIAVNPPSTSTGRPVSPGKPGPASARQKRNSLQGAPRRDFEQVVTKRYGQTSSAPRYKNR